MVYEQHLKRAEAQYGKLLGYQEVTEPLDRCVILLRSNGCEYGRIQGWLGCIGKKQIRNILLKWAPELIDLDCNHHKKQALSSKGREKYLINKFVNTNRWEYDLDEDYVVFYVQDDTLWMKGDIIGTCKFLDWDDTTQAQIVNQIKNYV